MSTFTPIPKCRTTRHEPRTTLFFLALCCCLAFTSCSKSKGAYHEQILAFGTLIEVKIWNVDEKTGQQAVEAITKDFEYMHHAWHAWRPGVLGRINQLLPSGEAFTVAPSVIPLIKMAKDLSARSGNRFNPAIGNLIRLWGFASDLPPKGPPPTSQQLEDLLAKNPIMEDVILEGISMRSTNPAVRLDFGAFAKGYGVDAAIEHLREMGIKDAVINAGGDLRAIGRHGDRPWRVGIRDPRGSGILASVEVEGDESVFTSGDYERFFEYDAIKYHHIIDPHSGYPARGTISVTVFHDNAAEADAAATALFIAGPEDWFSVAKAMGVKGVMLIDTNGKIYMTPELKNRIYFESDKKPEIIYSESLS